MSRTAEHWRRHWLRRLERRELEARLLQPLARPPGPAGPLARARLVELAAADRRDLGELQRVAERLIAEM